jgi:hypothetical protein
MLWTIAGAGALFTSAACTATYSPGELLSTPGGTRSTAGQVGCLDVAVHPIATDEVGRSAAIVDIAFGERCGQPACLDLAGLRATSRQGDGRSLAMFVSDPREEIRPATLDARAGGHERLVLRPSRSGPDEPGPPPGAWTQLCVDYGRLACDERTDEHRVVCFARPAHGGAT